MGLAAEKVHLLNTQIDGWTNIPKEVTEIPESLGDFTLSLPSSKSTIPARPHSLGIIPDSQD